MSVSHRFAARAAVALGIALSSAGLFAGVPEVGGTPAVRVLFLDKLGARSAQKLIQAEGVERVATFDPGRAIVLCDAPEKVAEIEALLRKSDPGLLAREPHAPLVDATEGAPEIERTLDTTDAKSGSAMLRAIYALASVEPGRDGHSVRLHGTAEQVAAAESLLRVLGLLAGS